MAALMASVMVRVVAPYTASMLVAEASTETMDIEGFLRVRVTSDVTVWLKAEKLAVKVPVVASTSPKVTSEDTSHTLPLASVTETLLTRVWSRGKVL